MPGQGLDGRLPAAGGDADDGEIYAAFLGRPEEGKTFFHGHTYTGNPLAAAVALASLELFETRKTLENLCRSATGCGRGWRS